MLRPYTSLDNESNNGFSYTGDDERLEVDIPELTEDQRTFNLGAVGALAAITVGVAGGIIYAKRNKSGENE